MHTLRRNTGEKMSDEQRLVNLEKRVESLEKCQCAGCRFRAKQLKEREEQFELERAR